MRVFAHAHARVHGHAEVDADVDAEADADVLDVNVNAHVEGTDEGGTSQCRSWMGVRSFLIKCFFNPLVSSFTRVWTRI